MSCRPIILYLVVFPGIIDHALQHALPSQMPVLIWNPINRRPEPYSVNQKHSKYGIRLEKSEGTQPHGNAGSYATGEMNNNDLGLAVGYVSTIDDVTAGRKLAAEKEDKAVGERLVSKDGKLWLVSKNDEHGGLEAEDDEENWLETEKRKWGQNSMSVWGKRSNDKRKWGENSMSVWGKRSTDIDNRNRQDIDKRKWGENSMSVWGKRAEFVEKDKRKWGENTMSVWGKRTPKSKEIVGINMKKEKEDDHNSLETTKAGGSYQEQRQERHLTKRSLLDNPDDDDDDSIGDWYDGLSKRSRPYRRSSYPKPYDGPKRNWETNTMKVWGKRGGLSTPYARSLWSKGYSFRNQPKVLIGKRKWTSDNAIRIWGKRSRLGLPIYDEDDDVIEPYES